MKLQKIVNRLQRLHPKEIDLSLDRVINLCKKLDKPQDKIKAISVVGTNGKYSTIQAMYSILKEASVNCNVYISPHIKKLMSGLYLTIKNLVMKSFQNFWKKLKILMTISQLLSLKY